VLRDIECELVTLPCEGVIATETVVETLEDLVIATVAVIERDFERVGFELVLVIDGDLVVLPIVAVLAVAVLSVRERLAVWVFRVGDPVTVDVSCRDALRVTDGDAVFGVRDNVFDSDTDIEGDAVRTAMDFVMVAADVLVRSLRILIDIVADQVGVSDSDRLDHDVGEMDFEGVRDWEAGTVIVNVRECFVRDTVTRPVWEAVTV
jgi:hypothetical protein